MSHRYLAHKRNGLAIQQPTNHAKEPENIPDTCVRFRRSTRSHCVVRSSSPSRPALMAMNRGSGFLTRVNAFTNISLIGSRIPPVDEDGTSGAGAPDVLAIGCPECVCMSMCHSFDSRNCCKIFARCSNGCRHTRSRNSCNSMHRRMMNSELKRSPVK